MKATLESTNKMVSLAVNGVHVDARIWEGHTEAGVPFHAYIIRVAVKENLNQSEFQAALQDSRAPSAEIAAIPLRMII